MAPASEYALALRSHGFRVTSQRMAILHVLQHASKHLSPAQVYKQARRNLPGLTETTVYRTLEFLAENGLVWSTNTGNGHLMYEIAGDNHHHLICRSCGSEVEVKSAPLNIVYSKLEAASGYLLTGNHTTFVGLCPKCQKDKLRQGAA